MATNDNRAMVEAARAYYDKVLDYSAVTIIELMAGLASEQSALAVAAERTRVANRFNELREGHKAEGYLHCACDGCGRLVEYINELRGATDE